MKAKGSDMWLESAEMGSKDDAPTTKAVFDAIKPAAPPPLILGLFAAFLYGFCSVTMTFVSGARYCWNMKCIRVHTVALHASSFPRDRLTCPCLSSRR
jgi:hypothetical protein